MGNIVRMGAAFTWRGLSNGDINIRSNMLLRKEPIVLCVSFYVVSRNLIFSIFLPLLGSSVIHKEVNVFLMS